MHPIIQEVTIPLTPEVLATRLAGEPGLVLLRSSLFDSPHARYSFLTAQPFLTLRAFGSRCELKAATQSSTQFGNPWHVLDGLMARYELLDDVDLPFPLGGCFGYWGYDLKNFVEPKLSRRAVNDLDLPDCQVGFYDSLVAFDHRLGKAWIVATGLQVDGGRSEERAQEQLDYWLTQFHRAASEDDPHSPPDVCLEAESSRSVDALPIRSNLSRSAFIGAVEQAQRYIRAGDIYQVNLAQRLETPCSVSGWEFSERLSAVSPAPFSAYLDCGAFQIISSSPELFLRLSGSHILTRPIKGTRPRSSDPNRDAQLAYELQTSPKEIAELVMITDLLRNDLGKVCEYGSVQVPELIRWERYPQVQHLVSTIEGRLRSGTTHFAAFASCFPGGSITGAPKFRAMEIIDELEPISRGPYTGCLGYLGFNRESQLSIAIRTAIRTEDRIFFHAGAGIVADSDPAAEYEETLAKAGGFLAALHLDPSGLPMAGAISSPSSEMAAPCPSAPVGTASPHPRTHSPP